MPQEYHLAPESDMREKASRLSSLSDTDQIRAVMSALEPDDAALMIAHAPGIEAQTRLVWSLAKSHRAAVLDRLPAAAVASLIQNQERRNRRLLGDISLEQFVEILRFCQPRQRYYWLALANSFADMGANLLVQLLDPLEIATALLTVPEFRSKLSVLHRYIPGGFETEPPVRDKKLKAILTRLSIYDPDRYREVIETAMRQPPEEVKSPDIPGGFSSEPLAPELPRMPDLKPLIPGQEIPVSDEETHPMLLVPLAGPGDSLLQQAVAGLAPARRQELERELEKMLRQEVMAEGGSLAQRDVERAAARIEACVRLGLQGTPEEPAAFAEVLRDVPFYRIVERGAIVLERLRQEAFRLRAFSAVLDAGQRDLLADLAELRATMDPKTGAPALLIRQVGRRKPRPVPVTELQERLADISLWVAFSRALGIRALSEKLAARSHGSLSVLAALGVSLLQYGKWDPRALRANSLRELRDQRFDPDRKGWRPSVTERLRDALDGWMEHARMEDSMRPRFRSRVLEAMEHLERFLGRSREPCWDRFAPGERRSSGSR